MSFQPPQAADTAHGDAGSTKDDLKKDNDPEIEKPKDDPPVVEKSAGLGKAIVEHEKEDLIGAPCSAGGDGTEKTKTRKVDEEATAKMPEEGVKDKADIVEEPAGGGVKTDSATGDGKFTAKGPGKAIKVDQEQFEEAVKSVMRQEQEEYEDNRKIVLIYRKIEGLKVHAQENMKQQEKLKNLEKQSQLSNLNSGATSGHRAIRNTTKGQEQ